MATIINNPPTSTDEGSGVAFIVGILAVAILAILFVVYLLPGLRAANESTPTQTEIKINLPTPSAPASTQAP
jgi:flagellar biogenesis protein FliO